MRGHELGRRDFLKVGSSAGGGLLIAIHFPLLRHHDPAEPTAPHSQALALNAYVEIGVDGSVTIVAPCPEIGQGVRTSLPMIVADELGADWRAVTYRQAAADPRYGGMTVGGSDSVSDYWEPLRLAGAAARELLKRAAAERWGVSLDGCRAARGAVVHTPTGRRASYGSLADAAASLSVPEPLPLKDPGSYELIGTPVNGVDVPAIVTGTAEYGLDVRLPGMLYVVVARSPVHGGRLASFDAGAALRVPGVRFVLRVEPLVLGGQLYGAVRSGVAVIAENTWAAIRGRDALTVRWDEGRYRGESSERIRSRFRERATRRGAMTLRAEGDALAVNERAAREVEAEYELPPLAHVCMEPVNFTADVQENHAVVWGPTQTPRFLQGVLAFGFGLPRDSVEVHPTLSGGGFGRRLAFDYGVEAAMISKKLGAPVQVIWSREDDVRHDYYRTPSYHRMRAGLDDTGRVVSWYHHILSASLSQNSEITPPDREPAHPGIYDVQGAADIPYDIDDILVEYTPIEIGLQMGSWRSVAHSFNVFAVNCFVDELAAAAQRDPLDFTLRMLGEPRIAQITLPLPGRRGRPRPDTGSLRRVLELAADRAGWGRQPPSGHARGIACCYYKRTYAAHVAEVSVDPDGSVAVHRIVAALDCGRVINPRGVEAQAVGAALDGIATMFNWAITIEDGRVQQSNFHDYPLPTIAEAPEVEVHLVPGDGLPSGIGEPPYPSVAPAIANAIFAATGIRVRRLPVRPADLRG